MAMEFKITEVSDGNSELFITAQDTSGDKLLWFTQVDDDDNQIDFDVLGLQQLKELGIFLNHKIGFNLINIYDLEKEIDKEYKINNPTDVK
jgi:hypothetical protein